MVKPKTTGRGTRKDGGVPAPVGHLYAFGNTEEQYRLQILGARARGHKQDPPLDHSTGRGRVRKQHGKYAHALSQGARVTHSADRRGHGRHLSAIDFVTTPRYFATTTQRASVRPV